MITFLQPNRSKIVENLAVVDYDTNNLHLAPYDWRLSFWNLEERDGYFSKLKTTIEGFKWVFVFSRMFQITNIYSQETPEKKSSRCRTLHGEHRIIGEIALFAIT